MGALGGGEGGEVRWGQSEHTHQDPGPRTPSGQVQPFRDNENALTTKPNKRHLKKNMGEIKKKKMEKKWKTKMKKKK